MSSDKRNKSKRRRHINPKAFATKTQLKHLGGHSEASSSKRKVWYVAPPTTYDSTRGGLIGRKVNADYRVRDVLAWGPAL